MYNARPPSQLILQGSTINHAEAWRQWYAEFKSFLHTSGVNKGGSDVKATLLLELIGPKGYDIYSSFVFDKDEDSQDYDKIVKKFNQYFVSKPDCTMARYNFFTRNQGEDESIEDYVDALRLLAKECQFGHLEEGLIRDRVVCGVLEDSLRDALLKSEGLTLENAVKICQASNEEATQGTGATEQDFENANGLPDL